VSAVLIARCGIGPSGISVGAVSESGKWRQGAGSCREGDRRRVL